MIDTTEALAPQTVEVDATELTAGMVYVPGKESVTNKKFRDVVCGYEPPPGQRRNILLGLIGVVAFLAFLVGVGELRQRKRSST